MDKKEIKEKLIAVSILMNEISEALQQLDDKEWNKHGFEIKGASQIALQWAKNLK
jgi:hypothetical protein